MIVGYARVSTVEQEAGFEAQQRDLSAAGCEKLFAEKLSSVNAERPQLEQALDFVREGDVFVVTKLDRLARSMADFVRISKVLEDKKVTLRVLAMGLDTGTATGRLMFNVVSSVAQFEREVMLERQREGIAKAKAEGRYKGRPVSLDHAQIKALKAEGLGATEIADQVGCSRRAVYKVLGA
jgi:DNA invertase Pin-like site-specific DNA recombinase